MSREEESRRLLQYFYGELAPAEQAAFERHLEGCEFCRKELKDLRALSEQVDHLQLEPAEPDLRPILARARAAMIPLRPVLRPAWTLVAAGLAILAIVLGFWLAWSPGNESAGPVQLAQGPDIRRV